jgi:transposase InsO family protein
MQPLYQPPWEIATDFPRVWQIGRWIPAPGKFARRDQNAVTAILDGCRSEILPFAAGKKGSAGILLAAALDPC